MTTPANPPTQAILQSLVADRCPINELLVAATTAVDLTLKASWPDASNAPPCASEIYFPTAGTFTGQLAGDATPKARAVIAGQTLKGAWVYIPAGNALACVARF